MTHLREELTPQNCTFLMIDHQVGLLQFLPSINPTLLKDNILGMAKTAKAFDIPLVMGTSWPQGPNGPTLPELRAIFPAIDVIDRPTVNFWNDPASKQAVESTGRKKLVISGLATEVCAAFPALSAIAEGYDVYVVIDACADFNSLITQVTMHRLAAAGVTVTTWVAVLAEIARNTRENGHIIGQLLSEHMPQYYAAMNAYLQTAKNGDEIAEMVKLNGHPPIQQGDLAVVV